MKNISILEKKILSDLKILSPAKVSEVADFVEYVKTKGMGWKQRFKLFLKKIEPKMKSLSYSAITEEVSKTRK